MFHFTLNLYTTTRKSKYYITTTRNVDVKVSPSLLYNITLLLQEPISQQRHNTRHLQLFTATLTVLY